MGVIHSEYEKAAICEEKELLLQELSPISSNPGLKDYIDKTTKMQRAFLFDKLYEFRSMIDKKYPQRNNCFTDSGDTLGLYHR